MNLLYSGVIYTCILAISVQAVVPRHLLMRARMSRTRSPQTSIKSRVDRALALFKPSGVGCCKLGEKTAKKKLSCHIHDPSRKKNMIQRINSAYTSSRLLVGKAEKCGERYELIAGNVKLWSETSTLDLYQELFSKNLIWNTSMSVDSQLRGHDFQMMNDAATAAGQTLIMLPSSHQTEGRDENNGYEGTFQMNNYERFT
ncbi:unnamed protein product [Mytilus edulis]|uniref:Uncharacterized protein n=1 Tax=Mytilus edulis TaxID=6550 RepID=A0A8S3QBL0_MYTED|nr:unnamed protein product [Mytilus edulis]